ncbi:hypothetical protein [Streptomyces sp. NPDC058457]|uniref:hypothetical protein n=1 Tax=Streptomyces sp. NPDC058457 TaxID=3346507 RepID=UPI00365195C1
MSDVLVEPGGFASLAGEEGVDGGLAEDVGELGVGLQGGTGLAEVGGGRDGLKAGTGQ